MKTSTCAWVKPLGLLPAVPLAGHAQTGNVGIGITNPQATLHVGGSTSTVRFDGQAGMGTRVLTTDNNGTLGSQAQPTLGVSGQTLTLTSGLSSSAVTLPANTGPQGPTGATGATGPQGPQGPSGALGKYGDGSAGVLNVGTGGTVDLSTGSATNFQYTSINMQAGSTLLVPSGTVLRATGNITINGTVTVLTGAVGGLAVSEGVALGPPNNLVGGTGVNTIAASMLPLAGGKAGGAGLRSAPGAANTGGNGGGNLALLAAGSLSVGNGGIISANGGDATNPAGGAQGVPGAGGGGGGMLTLVGRGGLTINGTVRANGGSGSSGYDGNGGNSEGGGGGGGGGIIRLLAPSISVNGSTQTSGGGSGTTAGISATVNAGGGGGACGGNGGAPGYTGNTPASGSPGASLQTSTANPENLLN